MLIGILSDTHDRVDAAAAGLKVLRGAGAEFFIHCGDVGGERVLDLLAGAPTVFVWGNNDHSLTRLGQYANDLGLDCRGEFGELEIEGKKIAITHGDNPKLIRRATEPGKFDYLLMGHTHIRCDQRVGSLRIINPGALHRASPKSVAVLDPAKDILRSLVVPL
jgi:hypothetical protein